MSEHGFSETSSLLTATATSTSTIPGLGSTSGKAIKRLGSVVVYGVDAILIRRRLAQIEGVLTHKRLEKLTKESPKDLYNDLLELSRPLYSLSLCTRAFRLVMGEIGGMEFEHLAAAIVNWDVSLSYDLLKAVMFCLQSEGDLDGSSTNSTFPAQYYAAGLDAYKTRLPYGSEDLSKSDLCVAFLMFMGLVISSSRRPSFSKLVAVELDLVTFMAQIYPGLVEPKTPLSREPLRAKLVLRVLLKKLDPVNDYLPVTRLNKILSLTTTDIASPSSNELSTTSESDLLASIRLNIAYLQNAMAQAEVVLGQGPNYHSRDLRHSHLKSILELSRSPYSLSIRTRAFSLIMGEVGGMEFEDLAAAVVDWDVSLSYDLLKAIMFCLQSEGNPEASTLPAQYYGAGLDTYKTRLPYGSGNLSKSDLCVAFLMFLGLVISLSRSSFSRLVAIELDLATFMTQIYPSFLKPKMPLSGEPLRAELVLRVLLKKLDPNDYLPIAQLYKALSLTTTKDIALLSSNELSVTSGIDALASICSSIAYLRNSNHLLAQAEALLHPNSRSFIPSYRIHPKSVYSDILELSRPPYSLLIRTRAFRLIMGEVGGMEFEDLAAAVVNWDVSLSHDLLKAMMLCLQPEGILEGSSASNALPAQYCVGGLDAYRTRLPYGSRDLSKSDLCVAFLMFMGLVISLSHSSAFSRLVAIELDLVTFMTQIYPSFLKPKAPWSRELLWAELVLIALLKKLDPVNDYLPIARAELVLIALLKKLDPVIAHLPIARLHKILSLKDDVALPSSNELFRSDVLTSIRSSIAYFAQNPNHQWSTYLNLVYGHGDILELSSPVYILSIRTRAFCLTMREVGGMEFRKIAPAIANWPLSDLDGLLKAMLLCLKMEGNKIDTHLDIYHSAGLEAYLCAYRTQRRFAGFEPRWPNCSAFLLLLGLAISLSSSPGFARMIVELDILTFIIDSYFHKLTPEVWPEDLIPVWYVLHALLQALNPVTDIQPVTQILEILAIYPSYNYRINDWLSSVLLSDPSSDPKWTLDTIRELMYS